MKLRMCSSVESRFFKQYLHPEKPSAPTQLAHWLTRLLKRIGFTGRKETVSQSIPNNWKELSREFSEACLDYLMKNEVDIIVTADQTFLKFLLAQEELLVPSGVKRVGTNVKGPDHRKGVTLMLAAYAWRKHGGKIVTGLLPPFIVFNGMTGKTLDKKYKDWSRRPGHFGSTNFQYKHWFDGPITLRWINWLEGQFPQSEKIGLIWDACPSHKDSKVQARVRELFSSKRLFTFLIPPGLTSVLQVGV